MSKRTQSIKQPLGGILVAWALRPNQSVIVACAVVKVIDMSDMSGAQGEDQPRMAGSFLISHLNIRGQQQRGILGIRFQHFKNNL